MLGGAMDTLDHTSGGGAVTVAIENVATGAPVTVAVAVFVPGAGPVTNFAAAFPSASVITVDGVTVPPPAMTANTTLTPGLGALEPSATCTRIESEKLSPAGTLVGWGPSLFTCSEAVI
jgi:hypothetical protein